MRYLLCLMLAWACCGCMQNVETTDYKQTERSEQILSAFITPEGKMYLLGKEFDYEVPAAESEKVKKLFALSKWQYEYRIVVKSDGAEGIATAVVETPLSYRAQLPEKDIITLYCVMQKKADTPDFPICKTNKREPVLLSWNTSFSLNRVAVVNREAMLKTSRLAKPITMNLTVYTKKSTLRRTAEKVGAGVVNTGGKALDAALTPVVLFGYYFLR